MLGFNNKKTKQIDIQPTTSVYATYKNLTYKPWTAFAEFIDNSVQSYIDHKEQLEKLKINIIYYDNGNSKDDILIIEDNAFGMEIADFQRAIILDKPPQNTQYGRNEFGMGLKTAACWFGNIWKVISKQYGSTNQYSACVDVSELSKTKKKFIDLDITKKPIEEHYTKIVIKDLNKRIVGFRTKAKIKEFLASIFREDIRSGSLNLYYNNELISYDDPEIYIDENYKKWKKDIEFSILHKGKELKTKGFIAIRKEGSTSKAGLTLMRRGRVIIGGPDNNYRPRELFGATNSFPYQRIFGELQMDNWPVTQAKDNFDWNDEDLEQKFIDKLIPLFKEYTDKASKIRTRKTIDNKNILNSAAKNLKEHALIDSSNSIIPSDYSFDKSNDLIEHFSNENNDSFQIKDREYKKTVERNNIHYCLNCIYDDSISEWLTIEKKFKDSQKIYNIKLQMTHPFFSNLSTSEEYFETLVRFVLCFVIAEVESKMTSYQDGRIEPDTIRLKMSEMLKNYKDKDFNKK